jgi:DNA-binding transcriptional MerR regulator
MLLTKQAVADRFGVTTRTVDNWIRSGLLAPPVKLGSAVQSRVRFDAADVERAFHQLRATTAANMGPRP